MKPVNAIDVSHLPEHAMDWHEPVWWGNLLAILIETTTMALLIASYFYLRRNFDEWPPPRINYNPTLYRPVPDLWAGTVNLAVLVLSCGVMYWTDMRARAHDRPKVAIGLLIMVLVAAAATWLRFEELPAMHFTWRDNAYGSIVWWILITHLTYILAAGIEMLVMLAWVIFKGVDPAHALDVTLAGGYWYWVAGTWVVAYAVLYWSPRFF